MRIVDILQSSRYQHKKIAEKILCHLYGRTKEQLFCNLDGVISDSHFDQFDMMYRQYSDEKKPLEYVLGFGEYRGRQFLVTKDTLIPRPETEYMLESVHQFFDQRDIGNQVVLWDVGTGCGVLGISILIESSDHIVGFCLSDLSSQALDVARRNFVRFGGCERDGDYFFGDIQGYFVETDLTLGCWEYFADQSVPLLIVANLPYIPDQTFDDNADDTVKRREPRMAFVGGNDGLDLYRQMFAQILAYCQHSEHDAVVCFLEMMTWQFDTLTKEFEHSFHFSVTKTFHFNIIIVRADLI